MLGIMNRARSTPPSPDLQRPPLSPRAVAEATSKPMRLRVAESGMARAREQRDALNSERRSLVGQQGKVGAVGKAAADRIREIDALLSDIEAEVRRCRVDVGPLRKEHAERVSSSLAPIARDAAEAAIGALATLRGAVDLLNEVDDTIMRHGGEPHYPLTMEAPGRIELVAARWLRAR